MTWQAAHDWEQRWWGNFANTYSEETKQLIYADRMGLQTFHDGKSPFNFDLNGKSVLDIGGGPVSLLLKCVNVKGKVVDPLEMPDWILARYAQVGIDFEQLRGEEIDETGFDECWIYNVLLHVEDPELIVRNAQRAAGLIRIFEWIDTRLSAGHFQSLTEKQLNGWLGGEGKVELMDRWECRGKAYFGVFLTDDLSFPKEIDTKIHFLNSGPTFPYPYYLGIMSAVHVYGEKVKLWLVERPGGKYFDLLEGKIEIEDYPYPIPNFPLLQGRDTRFQRVTLFDNCVWRIMAEQGGTIMGLDSFTLKPFQDLLEPEKEILVGIDAPADDDSFCLHGATCKRGATIAQAIYEDSTRALNGDNPGGKHYAIHEDGRLRFGGAGIVPFLNHALRNRDKLSVAEFGLFSGYHHRESLHPDCRTIPYYATSMPEFFDSVTEDNVVNSSTGLAAVIKATLPESVWRPFE